MDVLSIVVVLGLTGGVVIAALIIALQRRSDNVIAADVANRAATSPTINMASIKVEGLGGLGLVIMCVGVSIAIPAIGRSMLLGGLLGLALAAGLIYWRRLGPLPSSGSKPGANVTLCLEDPVEPTASDSPMGLSRLAVLS